MLKTVGKPKKKPEEKKSSGYDWRYENSINNKKSYLDVSNQDWSYVPWRTNRSLSNHQDTVILSNIMNMSPDLDYQMQYDFYYYSIKKGFRKFSKEKVELSEEFSLVSEYYKYSNERTKEVLSILSDDQINEIRKKLEKGGFK